MTKKLLFLTVLLFLLSSVTFAQEDKFIRVDEVYYLLVDETLTAEITGCSLGHDVTTLVIPKTVSDGGKTYTVSKIRSESFWGAGFTSITLPEGITLIEEKAFYELGA